MRESTVAPMYALTNSQAVPTSTAFRVSGGTGTPGVASGAYLSERHTLVLS